MAAIVQFKTKTFDSGASSYTITLDGAATNGNSTIYFGDAATQVHSGACTFGGSNMTTDLDTEFGLMRVASFLVSAAGTALVATLGGTSNYNSGIALEVSGLASSPFEAGIVKSATGEGSATSHSCEYASGATNRIGFVFVVGPGRTFSGANGSSVIQIGAAPSSYALIYKDNLGSAAGSIDFTVDSAGAFEYFGATYLTASGGSAARAMHYNRLRAA
jgi:hypothetical protein